MKALPLFLAALVAGASYLASWALPIPDWAAIAWKGMGVGLLAIWASLQGRSPDHRLLAAVLGLGAVADMVLELHFVAGAAIFALGHVVAVVLYLRNRRTPRPTSQDRVGPPVIAAGFMFATAALSWSIAPAEWAIPVAVYSLFLAGMAAAAGLSRFPMAFAGALLFLLSDLLIFARMERIAGAPWASYAIWISYFGGQALIAWGVASRLAAWAAAGRR